MRDIRRALTKLLISTAFLVALASACFMDINGGLKGVLIVVIVILAFPITLLIGIDASRVIKREVPSHKSLRLLGSVLTLPQAIMGTVLVSFGAVYPVFGVNQLIHDVRDGRSSLITLVRILVAGLAFLAGIHYVREGLGLKKRN